MDTQETLEATEKALDAIEERLDDIIPEAVETVNAVKNNPVLLAGVALVALSAGVAVGYHVAKRRLEPKYVALAELEIAQAREFYSAIKKDEFPTPGDAVEALVPEEERAVANPLRDDAVRVLTDYQGKSKSGLEVVNARIEEVIQEVVQVTSNIFVDGKPLNADDWDQEAEEARRSEDHPYIVSKDEYFENADDFAQTQVTYYEGDDVLADEDDHTIDDSDRMVGDANLKKFGHGSEDRNLLYICNRKRGLMIEVCRSSGKYAKEVLGFNDDGDPSPGIGKFRGDDE